MMIGRTDGASASFVDYQVTAQAKEKESDAANVNEAVQGKTIGERNQETLWKVQENGSSAYAVELSEHAKNAGNLMTYTHGPTVELSSTSRMTRESELDALEKSIEQYRKMNETYRATGSPFDPREEQERMAAVTAKFSTEGLAMARTAKDQGISLSPVQQDIAPILKTATGYETAKAIYTPVTEIRTPHYRWTEETGIEETVSQEEEIAGWKETVRNHVASGITRSIESILQPYETYEEAYEKLHEEKGIAIWTSFDEDQMNIRQVLKPVQGEFGALASRLNNYLEEFGAEDSFFDDLAQSLNELDPQNENDLVNQIRKMIRTVQRGESIDTESKEFEEEVTHAIQQVYGTEEQAKSGTIEKKEEKETQEQKQGLSFLDMQRRAAEQDGQLLDEMLGKDHDRHVESPGEVLAKRKPDEKDAEFTDRLRHVDDPGEGRREPLSFRREDSSDGTETIVPKSETATLQALQDAWKTIGERLVAKIAGNASRTNGTAETA